MSQDIEKYRAGFEAQPALDDYRPLRRNSEVLNYTSVVVQTCWEIWTAAKLESDPYAAYVKQCQENGVLHCSREDWERGAGEAAAVAEVSARQVDALIAHHTGINRRQFPDEYKDLRKLADALLMIDGIICVEKPAAVPSDALDAATRAALSEALNTTLWLYRRLPHAYNKPPFVDHAILVMAEHLGMEHVPDAIKERAAIATSTSKGAQ